jgi:hypothetical protein
MPTAGADQAPSTGFSQSRRRVKGGVVSLNTSLVWTSCAQPAKHDPVYCDAQVLLYWGFNFHLHQFIFASDRSFSDDIPVPVNNINFRMLVSDVRTGPIPLVLMSEPCLVWQREGLQCFCVKAARGESRHGSAGGAAARREAFLRRSEMHPFNGWQRAAAPESGVPIR